MWLSCLQCGQTYFGSGKFCTPKCEHDFTYPTPKTIKIVTKGCNFCGKNLTSGQKNFCSEKCRQENLGQHASKLTCQTCDKKFLGYARTKYCSTECRDNKNKPKKEFTPGLCRVCGKSCPASEAVCSWKCAVDYNAEK